MLHRAAILVGPMINDSCPLQHRSCIGATCLAYSPTGDFNSASLKLDSSFLQTNQLSFFHLTSRDIAMRGTIFLKSREASKIVPIPSLASLVAREKRANQVIGFTKVTFGLPSETVKMPSTDFLIDDW